MKKKTKIFISVLVVMIAALTAGSFWAGNYLVDYALYRADQAPQSANDGKAPVNETYGNEEANKAEEQRLTDLWLKTVSMEKKEIVSQDGLTLRALQYTADPASHRYALVIHGYTSNKEAMQTEAGIFPSWATRSSHRITARMAKATDPISGWAGWTARTFYSGSIRL